ncbi:flagella basal body P-ring formation protein FlgA [Marinobacter segnicrescens]|uniref:Flagella basal body P-ring formation protein FlgA n=1 Tax=Marinobacter segnicrescens TaxID=430453 RepID=A0A1H9YA52_9GAMM|nr:flagellar basal body P-ring formation chaperone FlgA [Marinobacter segnicrescens]SES65736.1 flagella basal body P-ring formation protein FlgA [Marinobacter segnicrescens]
MRILITLTLILFYSATTLGSEKTEASDILAAGQLFMEEFVETHASQGFDAEYTLGNLDPRLALAPCPEDGIDVSFSSDPWQTTQPSLMVSCQGKRPWRMYLSVSLDIYGDALIAARPLSRGDRLTAAMVATDRVVVNAIRRGTITDREQLLGLELKRSVNAGTPFTPDLVTSPDAVARGDHVMITARSGSFAVKTRGKALANARVGEQVLVENLSSARKIRARVTGPGQVEITM